MFILWLTGLLFQSVKRFEFEEQTSWGQEESPLITRVMTFCIVIRVCALAWTYKVIEEMRDIDAKTANSAQTMMKTKTVTGKREIPRRPNCSVSWSG